MNETLVAVEGSERAPVPGARALGPTHKDEWIEVTVKVKRRAELPKLDAAPEKILSRQELAERYGADPADITKVADAFKAFGLQVIEASAATCSVKLGGTAEQMQQAFGVKLFRYAASQGNYRGRVGALHVPDAIKSLVTGVFGLDNRRQARRSKHATQALTAATATKKARPWFVPSELAAIYDFPDGDGANQSIGVLEFGGAYNADDLAKFCQMTGLPNTATVVPVGVDGVTPARDPDADGEVMLDIEVIAALCPQARIPVYFASFTERGWIDALDAAVHDTENAPNVLSVSWGFAEGAMIWTKQALRHVNEALHQAALVGMTVCVASGDDGSDDEVQDGHAHVDFPSSSPYVLAVGGTTLRAASGHIKSETVWSQGVRADGAGHGSTGGGVSDFFATPSWQLSLAPVSVNPNRFKGRGLPDVSAVADANTGYFVVSDDQAGVSGGTSAATPLWAALIARINAKRSAPVGYLTPRLYAVVSGQTKTLGELGCRDVSKGNNATAAGGGYEAGEGWDACSGWGTPSGKALLKWLG